MMVVTLNDREVQRALDRLSRLRTRELGEAVGAVVESQTRRRISEEKTAPDGTPWAPWSSEYAKERSRRGGGSLLERSGALVDSIAFEVSGDEVIVGSPLEYAGAHQDGTDAIPARPYLGLSDANVDEVVRVIEDYLGEVARS